MGRPTANRIRIATAGAILCLLLACATIGVHSIAPWRNVLAQSSYDSLHRLSGETWLADSPVVIVYLDLPSCEKLSLDPLRPWPRALHAQLLRRLTSEGARAVIFDVVFSGMGPIAEADDAFADAIRKNGRVILAAECNYESSHATSDESVRVLSHTIQPPYERFRREAAATGLAIQAIDADFTVRSYVAGLDSSEPSLTWAAANCLHLPVTQQRDALERANGHWLRFYGPPLSIPHVSFAEALDSQGTPEDFFRDRIVLIGARPWVKPIHQLNDEFRSPYNFWSKKLFLPGVEVHATEMLNLVRGDWLDRLSRRSELMILLACAGLLAGGLVWLRPLPATFAAMAAGALILAAALFAFSRGTWFPWLLVCGVQLPMALGGSVLFHSIEWVRARRQYELEKRRADAKIREQAELIEKANDAILVQDLDGRITYANASAELLYGFGHTSATSASEGPAGADWAEVSLPDADAARIARETVVRTGEWNGELRQQTITGRAIVVASRWTLIRNESGRPAALLLINTDITEKKQLESEFLRNQRMNTIGTLAGGMAHDLNNALAPILMGAQLLRRRTKDEETQRLLRLMESQTNRSAEMVRQVLLFARGKDGEMEQIQVATLVKELEKIVRETFPKSIAVETFLPDDLWPVRGNPTQLHQVLLNLCVNARDAMPQGGRLSFAADNVTLNPADAARFPEGKTGEYVSLMVSDTGMGIPPEIQARIFEPFFTTKTEARGTGIGLATVLRIVRSHGGFVGVDSEPGQGTSFEVLLPRAAPKIPSAPAATRGSVPRGNNELILAVDDENAVRDLVREGLEMQGYRTLVAADGAEALVLFEQNRGGIKLLLTDAAMPGMDGTKLAAALRQRAPGLPVILASAEDQADGGDFLLLRKPFSLDDLLAAVHRALHSNSESK